MNNDGWKIRSFLWIVMSIALLCPVVAAGAADWPAKPVRLIVPYAAGGNADIWARIIADSLSKALNEQVYVDNRGGAGAFTGSQAAAKADSDGYTLLLSGIGSQIVSPVINQNSSIDVMRDYTHIAFLGGSPYVFVVHPSLGVGNFRDLVAFLKSNKTGMPYASPGLGSFGNLLAELLAQTEKVKLDHIPYKGAGPAMTDVMGGHVKIGCVTWTAAAPHIRARSVIPIAVSSAERVADFPDVPTLKELGYPNLVATSWFALSGPAGLPNDIVDRLNREVIKALATERARKQMEQEALQTQAMTARQFTAFMQSELDKWTPIAQQVTKRP